MDLFELLESGYWNSSGTVTEALIFAMGRFELGFTAEAIAQRYLDDPRIQVVEYLRAFLSGRVGWDYMDSLLIISGAFGIFDRNAVLRVGGYLHDTVGEDMELVVRMHRYHRENNIPYRVRFLPEPVCWTEVPDCQDAAEDRSLCVYGLH